MEPDNTPLNESLATSRSADAGRGEAVTLRTLARMAREQKRFACLTCYDATTARWLDRAGIEVLLVGDTAAEVILGHTATIHAPLDFMIEITAAVKRGAPRRVVMADMPFLSYQCEPDQAIRNAGRFLTQGMADCVKMEVDRSFAPLVERMARAGIPVVAHVGSRPQQAKLKGGYFSAGRTAEEAVRIVADASALEAAGAGMLLVEACPPEVTQLIVERATIPVIGCGAGASCHGQVVVLQDILGMSEWQPAFARPMAAVGKAIESGAAAFADLVRSGKLPGTTYRMEAAEQEKLRAMLRSGTDTHAAH
ncbi:MAG: 3-methyl-2-oxobutanoate hydroxymethyltransferase [Planctomycetes bacterium]|nr:3-methyl-2-oxobutanoate hydroxymethyltransferase [Planctomycetota bacterium]